MKEVFGLELDSTPWTFIRLVWRRNCQLPFFYLTQANMVETAARLLGVQWIVFKHQDHGQQEYIEPFPS